MKTTVSGVELNLEDIGTGPALLFVHGFPLSGRMWIPSVERLAGKYRCIVPDLRGMGLSKASPEANMRRYADDLVAILDAVGQKEPVVLIGMSMGGYVVFEFFRQHRSRVRALVLVDTAANDDSPETLVKRRGMIDAVAKSGSKAAAEAMIDKLFASKVNPSLRREWLDSMAAAPPVGVKAAIQAMADRQDSRPTLATIDVPTLLVVGELDVITPPDVHREMNKAIPGSKLEVIPGAGHMLAVEKPDAFVNAVEQFLAGALG